MLGRMGGGLGLGMGARCPAAAPGGGEPATDPFWNDVVLLAGFEAASLADADESQAPHATSTVGANMQHFADFARFGTLGLGLLAGDSGLEWSGSDDWRFGAGAFTIEGWFSWAAGSSAANSIILRSGEFGGGQLSWRLARITGALRLSVSTDGATLTTTASGAWAPVEEQWHHIACDFDGAAYRMYADGSMVGKFTTPLTMFAGTDPLRMGTYYAASPGFSGFVDEVRITKGIARYASDGGFTVPAAAYPRG